MNITVVIKIYHLKDFANYFFEGAEKSSSGAEAVNFMKGLITKTVRAGATLVGGIVAGADRNCDESKE